MPVIAVRATRGKWLRAEPVAALYEQGRVKHAGAFPALEDEMCDFGLDGSSQGRSPDRLDALVWAVTALSFGAKARAAGAGAVSPTCEVHCTCFVLGTPDKSRRPSDRACPGRSMRHDELNDACSSLATDRATSHSLGSISRVFQARGQCLMRFSRCDGLASCRVHTSK